MPLLIALAGPALADSRMPAAEYANRQLEDPAKEQVAAKLMHTIRCVVCQGQSVADSNAEMAGDMRALIRERIDRGDSPEEVRRWLIERYGDWVSYKPVLDVKTAPLWIAPLLFLGAGLVLARGRFRKKRA